MKSVAPKISFGTKFQVALDKAIGTVSPSLQLARMQSRAQVARLHQYAGADTGRSRNPPKSLRSPDSLGGQSDALVMQRRAQDQGRDNAFIGHLANQYRIYALGDISYIPQTGDGVADQAYRDYWQEWMANADVQGRFHFIDMMQLSLAGVIYNGRHGLIHHHNDDGTFQLQPIMGYNIGNPQSIRSNPSNIQGIVIDQGGAVVAYDLYQLTISGMVRFVQQVPASIFSCLNPVQSTDEYSAKTPLHAILNDAHDMKVVEAAWMDKIKWAGFKTAVFNTPNGAAPEVEDPNHPLDGVSGVQSPAFGRVVHQAPGEELHGESGFNVEMLKNENPSNNETDYLLTKLAQIAMAVNLPLPFVWVMMGLPGTYTRLISEQAKRAFQHGPLGQKWLERTALNSIKRKALLSGINRGVIPWTKNWDKGFFMYPAHPSMDVGRESKANLDENRQGIRAMATITAEEGLYWKDVDNQLGDEAENKIKLAIEKAKKLTTETGVPITWDQVMPHLQAMSANPPPATAESGQQEQTQLSSKKKEEKSSRLEAKLDELSTKLGDFDPSKHPRGQPENAGEFAPEGGGSKKKSVRREGIDKISEIIKAESAAEVRILKNPNGERGDEVEEIFKQSGINVSGIRKPLIYSKGEDGKANGGIMADTDGDFKVDIAVAEAARGQGVGEKLLRGAIRYYARNKDTLAEESDVDVEDYNLIVLPISTKMHPLLKRLGFKQDGEEWVISSEDIEHTKN